MQRALVSLGVATALATLGAIFALALPANAIGAAPAWKLSVISMPTNFAPGAHDQQQLGPLYTILATNVGSAAASGPIVVTDTLPAGLSATDLGSRCSAVGQEVTCTLSETIQSGSNFGLDIAVDVDSLADPTILDANEVTIESPGAAAAEATTTTTVSAEPAPFGLLPAAAGLGASLTEADGSPVGPSTFGAGAHPDQLTIDLGFLTRPGGHGGRSTPILPSGDGARDTHVFLPEGLVIDPSATPVRCTEAQLETFLCPAASALGRASVRFNLFSSSAYTSNPLFNMVPPPGSAASFAFDPGENGVFMHVLGGLQAGDYALAGAVEDIPSFFHYVAYGAQLQFWGDPSSSSHDHVRGYCTGHEEITGEEDTCPVPPQSTPALSTPTSCSSSLSLEAEIDSWEEPGNFLGRSAPLVDLKGSQTTILGCNAVPFNPSLSLQSTTSLADSPTGLDVDLHLPQSANLSTSATAHLKTAAVILPEGLVVNLSSVRGLAGCAPGQVGINPQTGIADGSAAHCPDASKIGAVEADSPLLAKYDSENKVLRDAGGHPIPEPVEGSLYVASPKENPFGSLLGIYLVFEDPEHGIVVKLAGKVEADSHTGRLTAIFENLPQLPFEDFKLHLFGGAGAPLKTSLTCGAKTATAELTPMVLSRRRRSYFLRFRRDHDRARRWQLPCQRLRGCQPPSLCRRHDRANGRRLLAFGNEAFPRGWRRVDRSHRYESAGGSDGQACRAHDLSECGPCGGGFEERQRRETKPLLSGVLGAGNGRRRRRRRPNSPLRSREDLSLRSL